MAPGAVADTAARDDLVAMHLIDPVTFCPNFPILGPDRILPVRNAMAALAARIVENCATEMRALLTGLDEDGRTDSVPALVLGHVMDRLLWSRVANALSIPDTALTRERPEWNGVFWAIWPPVDGAIGTNEAIAHGWRLSLIWCEANTVRLKALQHAEWLPGMLAALSGAPPPREAVAAGLMEADGRPCFPVLRPNADLTNGLERLADQVADIILGARDMLLIPGLAAPEAHVIALHELIWAMPEALGHAGLWPSSRYPEDLAAALVAAPA